MRQVAPLPRRWQRVPAQHQSQRLFFLHEASGSVLQQSCAGIQLQRTASPLALPPLTSPFASPLWPEGAQIPAPHPTPAARCRRAEPGKQFFRSKALS